MEQRKNNENKIYGGINQLLIGKSTHNNQPKEAVCNRCECGEDS
jgi:hypothetical protein